MKKAQFLSELEVKEVPEKKDFWELLTPLRFYSAVAKQEFEAPTGFQTDFGTVPHWPVIYLLFGGVGDKEAALHDYLYSGLIGRSKADRIYREALIANGQTRWKAWFMWAGVRLGGWRHYEQKEKK